MLNLDYRDARPIYEQVRDGLRRLMVSGVIQEGEQLPSVRAMATSLAINPNTIQRAYELLEAEAMSAPSPARVPSPRPTVRWTAPGGTACCGPLTRRPPSFSSWACPPTPCPSALVS